MKPKVNLRSLGRTTWREYASRFVFGGTVTLLAGLIAKKYGAGIGGLFLAFPAIFPATATLIAKHEKQKEQKSTEVAALRARVAAGADATGAALGSIGLIGFAGIVWLQIEFYSVAATLLAATSIWFLTSFLLWQAREIIRQKSRTRLSHR